VHGTGTIGTGIFTAVPSSQASSTTTGWLTY